jgi:hypothetical protein
MLLQASGISEEILKTEYDNVRLLYTSFKSAISFKPTIATIMSPETLEKSEKIAEKMDQYEIEGPDRAELLQDLGEYQLACMLYYAMNEACTSEHASRMQVWHQHSSQQCACILAACSTQHGRPLPGRNAGTCQRQVALCASPASLPHNTHCAQVVCVYNTHCAAACACQIPAPSLAWYCWRTACEQDHLQCVVENLTICNVWLRLLSQVYMIHA